MTRFHDSHNLFNWQFFEEITYFFLKILPGRLGGMLGSTGLLVNEYKFSRHSLAFPGIPGRLVE